MAEKEVSWCNVTVDVGWGKLRGKTCLVGNTDVKNGTKIVGVHGWLDNANSFDRLVPLLPLGVEVLVLDLPGHGLSDHLPLGAHYDVFIYLYNLWKVVFKLGWEKFVLMGHSMGAAVCNYFAALFPEYVTAIMNIDYITPIQVSNKTKMLQNESGNILKAEQSKQKHSSIYDEKTIVERMMAARDVYFEKDAAYILLSRSARQLSGGYVWNHDPKVRSHFLALYSTENWLEIVSSIKCPVLVVWPNKGLVHRFLKRTGNKVLPIYVEKSIFEYHNNAQWLDIALVEGSHEVHLIHPERVAPAVITFLHKVASKLPNQAQSKL